MKNLNLKKSMLVFGMLLIGLYSCQESVPQIEKPKKTISVEKAKELQQNYKETRGAILKDTFGYEDTREFWYSIEELEEYLAYVKQEASEKGYDDLGIRIYFAAYPTTKERPFGLSTIFLAPTGKKEYQKGAFDLNIVIRDSINDNIYDIDPLNQNQGGWPPTDY